MLSILKYFQFNNCFLKTITNSNLSLYSSYINDSKNELNTDKLGEEIEKITFSPKREIEYFRNEIYRKLFKNSLEQKTWDTTEEEDRIRKKMQEFNVAYSLIEMKFAEKYEDNYKEKFKIVQDKIWSFISNIKIIEDNSWSTELDKIINFIISILIEEKLIEEHSVDIIFWEWKYTHCLEIQKQEHTYIFKPEHPISRVWTDTRRRLVMALKLYDYIIWWERQLCKKWFSPLRAIEKIRNKTFEVLFEQKVLGWAMTIYQAEIELLKINQAYALAKRKFQEIFRDSWERYFEHLRNVAYNILEHDPNANLDKVLIALLHDIIEDTDIDYNTIQDIFWHKIAIAVEAISKKPISKYILKSWNEEDIAEFNEIKNNWNILNSKWEIKAVVKKNKKREKCSPIELRYIKRFEKLKIKYKEIRNQDYFWHLESVEVFESHINKTYLANSNHPLSGVEIKEIAENALVVKFMDRLDNMKTIWSFKNWDRQEILKKAKETMKYFYKILREFYKKNNKYNIWKNNSQFWTLLFNAVWDIFSRTVCNCLMLKTNWS